MTVAGLVLVRQKPGSAKGVLFITIEDETDVANLIVWPSLFERQRRLILSAGMIGARGRVQREGEVIHLVAEHLIDLSDLLRSVGERTQAFPLPLRSRRRGRAWRRRRSAETATAGGRLRDVSIRASATASRWRRAISDSTENGPFRCRLGRCA